MRMASVMRRLLGCEERTVVEQVGWDDEGLVARVRPTAACSRSPRCGVCGARCPKYDAGGGLRRWRAMDLGSVRAWLEAEAPRVECAEHGVVVAEVPWARHKAGFTKAFEDSVAWLATRCSKSAVCNWMRIGWRTAGRIIERVRAEVDPSSALSGLKRIGIDEISHRKGHRYLTVVVDHDSGRLVYAAEGRDAATVHAFFDALGERGCAAIEAVTADAASWIRGPVEKRCPNAKLCMDPFHVVAWATEALDAVRRSVWNEARRSGQDAVAREVKGARYALWKNPEDLTERQDAKLATIERTNRPLYRAYLLKEQLRQVFKLPVEAAIELLDKWLSWARRCRLAPFVELAKRISRHRVRIAASLELRLSNGRVESMNTKIRLIMRRAFGFHSPQALIALAMLALGGCCPELPGRKPARSARRLR